MNQLTACPANERLDIRTARPDLLATICVTGSSSNAGKTTLCEELLEALDLRGRACVALKITRTHLDTCPRQNDGCGVCDDLDQPFRLIRDLPTLDVSGKDTGRYLAAGAAEVLWLIVDPAHMGAGVRAALDAVPRDAILVAEGNSFKDHVTGDTLTAMAMTDGLEMKDSARHVIDRVDVFVGNDATGAESSNGTPWVEAHQAANWIVERLDALTD